MSRTTSPRSCPYQGRAFSPFAVAFVLLFVVGCALLWPPEAEATGVRLYWTVPDTTSLGIEVDPVGYHSHFLLFQKAGETGTAFLIAQPDSMFVYDGEIDILRGMILGTALVTDLEPMTFYQFAVAAVDTLRNETFPSGRAGPLSPWSTPYRPADADPGAPATTAVMVFPAWTR